jgi:hypothetical protein
MDTTQNIWGEKDLDEGKIEFISIGNLCLWLLFKDADFWIGYQYITAEGEETFDGQNPPEDLDWLRWAMEGEVQKIQLLPVFPDMPLVVKSEYPLRISSDTKIQVFARIPIWIRVSIPSNNYQLIGLPIVKLSRTWFGTPLEGELCYHATTKARRSLSKIEPKPYLANCPIQISNKSEDELDFENFCYRVERLSIYEHEDTLWADETRIIYHGESLNSDVIMTGRLPEGISQKELLSKPRKSIQKSLATRTFKRFFDESLNFSS